MVSEPLLKFDQEPKGKDWCTRLLLDILRDLVCEPEPESVPPTHGVSYGAATDMWCHEPWSNIYFRTTPVGELAHHDLGFTEGDFERALKDVNALPESGDSPGANHPSVEDLQKLLLSLDLGY